MKIKFGSLVVAGSGKIGGHVASKNRGGAYLRTKVTPSNPQTIRQLTARSILASLSSAWSGLTASQRASWSNAVANFATTDIFGDIRNPSGNNLYVKLNTNLINTAQSTLNSAPEKLEVPFSGITSAVADISESELTVSVENENYEDVQCMVFATPSLPQGVSFVKNKLRFIGSFNGGTTTAGSPALLYEAYVAKFGVPAPGANIVISVKPVIATGQAGLAQTAKLTVQA
jgi:hypothetical protein